MVEYLRLIKTDSFTSIANNWHRPEMLVLMAIFSIVITAPFLRIYFGKIGYQYEWCTDA
jgi:hypothetical protein